jgi:hypothetical protein
MNVIAVIVFPLDTQTLHKKFESGGNTLILKKHERVRLWSGGMQADHFWVYGGDERSWRAFQKQLIYDLACDGIELKFSLLCGPDHMQDMETIPSEPWSCKEIVFSDIGRDTPVVSAENKELRQLDLYHPWKRIVVDCECARKLAETQVSFIISGHYMMGAKCADAMLKKGKASCSGIEKFTKQFSDPDKVDRMIEEFYTDSVVSASKVWLCHQKNDPSCTIRFIPKPKNRTTPKVSSSAIRRSIELSAPWKSIDNLPSSVLHGEILYDILSSRQEAFTHMGTRHNK